jgi:hypothetical protein
MFADARLVGSIHSGGANQSSSIQVFCFAAASRACLSAAQFAAYLSASSYFTNCGWP